MIVLFSVRGTLEILHERWLYGWFPLSQGHFSTVVCLLGAASELRLTYNFRLVLPGWQKMKDTVDSSRLLPISKRDGACTIWSYPRPTATFSTHSTNGARTWERAQVWAWESKSTSFTMVGRHVKQPIYLLLSPRKNWAFIRSSQPATSHCPRAHLPVFASACISPYRKN